MKSQKKGQNPPLRRSRARGKDGASDAPVVTAAAGPNEGTSIDPVTPPTARVSEALSTPGEVVIAPVSARAGVITEPAATAPSVAGASEAKRSEPVCEFPAPRPSLVDTSLRPRAEQIVKEYLPLAVGAGMIPLPGLDLAAIGGLQLKLLASLAEHYQVPFTKAQTQLIVTSLLGSVGTTFLAGAVLASAAKIVPFFGTVVGAASMPVAGGVITRALGQLAVDHFEAGGTMETFDLDVAQEAFLAKIAEAKAALA
jgi:uncharacterized protein (DUF697 family)